MTSCFGYAASWTLLWDGEGAAELACQGGKGGGVGGGGVEVPFEFAGQAGAFVEAEHAEGSGELVGDGGGLRLEGWCEGSGGGGGGGLVEEGQALSGLGEEALPETGQFSRKVVGGTGGVHLRSGCPAEQDPLAEKELRGQPLLFCVRLD